MSRLDSGVSSRLVLAKTRLDPSLNWQIMSFVVTELKNERSETSILYFYSILGWAGEGCGDANPGTNGSGEAVSLFSLKIG